MGFDYPTVSENTISGIFKGTIIATTIVGILVIILIIALILAIFEIRRNTEKTANELKKVNEKLEIMQQDIKFICKSIEWQNNNKK